LVLVLAAARLVGLFRLVVPLRWVEMVLTV
jgi:hypothetical protein